MSRSVDAGRRGWIAWWIGVFTLVVLAAVVATAWAVRQAMNVDPRLTEAQSRAIMAVAELPSLVRVSVEQVLNEFVRREPGPLLVDRALVEKPHWVRRFPEPRDPGYLLLSALDRQTGQNTVKLVRVSDGSTMGTWDPDWPRIHGRITGSRWSPKGSVLAAQAVHPLLLEDGDIVFNTNNALVRLAPCSPEPVWVLDQVFHHSVERSPDGTLWVPGIATDGFPGNPWLTEHVRDDSLVRVSLDGKVLENRSLSKILRKNGLEAELLGRWGFRLNDDPIHLNQITAAPHDSPYWKKGDLLLSARHLSAVFLYRPSTDAILWYRSGPWLNQHSADFVGSDRIVVLSNNVVSAAPEEYAFPNEVASNRVMFYDFATKTVSEPFATLLAEARPVTITGGRVQALADGGLFVEETTAGRHLRFTRDSLLWSRVNDYSAEKIGLVSWSRYLGADEAAGPLRALAGRACRTSAAAAR